MIKRNLYLYFRNKSGVIFSILGALISFILFIIFLQKNFLDSWPNFSHKVEILDYWMIGGTLSITGITTTFYGLSQLVKDKQNGVYKDLLMTDITSFKLKIGYVVSSSLIGIIMQLVVFWLMFLYFKLTDLILLTLYQMVGILCIIIINSVLSTSIVFLISQKINRVDNFGRLSNIISMTSGFLVGVYIPVGSLPTFAQNIIKFFPGNYVASLFRQILLNDLVSKSFSNQSLSYHFNLLMGVKIKILHLLSFNHTLGIICLLILISLFLIWLSSFNYNHLSKRR